MNNKKKKKKTVKWKNKTMSLDDNKRLINIIDVRVDTSIRP